MKVTLIGAGNVGHHLGKRFYKKKVSIQQVFSRNFDKAKNLAKAIKAIPIKDLGAIDTSADIYIIAVKDDAIAEVGEALSSIKGLRKKIIVHTSGAVASTVLANHFPNYGVFYPLQTFTKSQAISFKYLPICVDARKKKTRKILQKLGATISKDVRPITDEQRAILHVAAVIVNNFTNHLFYIGERICQKEDLDFTILKPLIQETVKKIELQSPFDMQTGPARRGDQATIKKHLQYLEQFPSYTALYKLLSGSIMDTY